MVAELLSRRHLVGALDPWVRAGVVTAGDAHVAASVCALCGESDPTVALAVACAVGAPQMGHSAVSARHAHEQFPASLDDADGADDPLATPGEIEPTAAALSVEWPVDRVAWLERVASSPVANQPTSPLVVDGGLIYSRRFWANEVTVAEHVARLAATPVATGEFRIDDVAGVLKLDAGQLAAVQRCLGGALGVLVGGPGTGKTRTVAALLAALYDRHGVELSVALAAPTGKAAARMAESVADAIGLLANCTDPALVAVAAEMQRLEPSTVHRLIGSRPGDGSTRYHAGHRMPHDVLIVDEASMVSLPLMAQLCAAMRPDARLIIVGDPGQLASVDAGSVLGDIVGAGAPVADRVATLVESRRFPSHSQIGRFAAAVRAGDADMAATLLREPSEPWHEDGPAVLLHAPTADGVLADIVESAVDAAGAARAGDISSALASLGQRRILCAHRRGRRGVSWWNREIEHAMTASGVATTGMYAGRPLMITANDAMRGLFNGDLGIVVRDEAGLGVMFPGADGPRRVSPSQIEAMETVHAMTIHKSQGSEFDHIVVVLPSATSPLATRELLYTAVTRARRSVTVVGDVESVRTATQRRELRVSGLSGRLLSATGGHGRQTSSPQAQPHR